MSYISLTTTSAVTLGLLFVFAILFLLLIRARLQNRCEQPLVVELAKRDNFAVGISYAASLFTMLMVASALLKGIQLDLDPYHLGYAFGLFAACYLFVKLGAVIHAKIILSRLNEDNEIRHKNVCVALVESGALIANALLVVAIYRWINPNDVHEFIVVLLSFFVVQLMLLLQSRWQEFWFAKANQGAALQQSFSYDNKALGLKYASHTVACAQAIFAALASANYKEHAVVDNLLTLIVNAGILIIVLVTLASLLTKIALPKINTNNEIDQQDNVGIAAVELAINLSLGFLFIRLFAH